MGFFRRRSTAPGGDFQADGITASNQEMYMTRQTVGAGGEQSPSSFRNGVNHRHTGMRNGRNMKGVEAASIMSVGESLAPHDQFDLYIPMRDLTKPRTSRGRLSAGKSRKSYIANATYDETSTASSITIATRDFAVPSKKSSNVASPQYKNKTSSREIENDRTVTDDNDLQHMEHEKNETVATPSHRPSACNHNQPDLPNTSIGDSNFQSQTHQKKRFVNEGAVLSLEDSCWGPDADENMGSVQSLDRQRSQHKQEKQLQSEFEQDRQDKNTKNLKQNTQSTLQHVETRSRRKDPPTMLAKVQQTDKITNVHHKSQSVEPQPDLSRPLPPDPNVKILYARAPTSPTPAAATTVLDLLSLTNCCGPDGVSTESPMIASEERSTQTLLAPQVEELFPHTASLIRPTESTVGNGEGDFVVDNQFFSQRSGIDLRGEIEAVPSYLDEGDTAIALMVSSDLDDGRDDNENGRGEYYVLVHDEPLKSTTTGTAGAANTAGRNERKSHLIPRNRSIPKIRQRSNVQRSASGRGRSSMTGGHHGPRRRSRSRGRNPPVGLQIDPADLY
jgi:hypothetical protein